MKKFSFILSMLLVVVAGFSGYTLAQNNKEVKKRHFYDEVKEGGTPFSDNRVIKAVTPFSDNGVLKAVTPFSDNGLRTLTSDNEVKEGDKPYTPTRLEWIAVEMNAHHKVSFTDNYDFDLYYLPLKKEDTILLSVHYNPEVNRKLMNANIEGAKRVLYEEAKKRGWTWLKIEERLVMAKQDDKK